MFIYYIGAVLILIGVSVLIYKRFRRSFFSFSKKSDNVVLQIRIPKIDDDRMELRTAPFAAEHMFASLHGLLKEDTTKQEHFSFELASSDTGIRFYVVVSSDIAQFVESQIYAQYPTCHISRVADYAPNKIEQGHVKVTTLSLAKPTYFPIKTFRDFEIDPMSAVTSALSDVSAGEDVWFQLLVRPIADVWQDDGYSYIEKVRAGTAEGMPSLLAEMPKAIYKEFLDVVGHLFSSLFGAYTQESPYRSPKLSTRVDLSSGQELEIKSIENKLSKMGFEVVLRFVSHSDDEHRAESLLRSLVASMKQFSTANLNSFRVLDEGEGMYSYSEYKNRSFDGGTPTVLNIEELASIYHLPSSSVSTPGVSWVGAKKSEPPEGLPTKDCNYIGETLFRDKKVKFGIKNKGDDRVRHMYLIGKTGTGKSTLFKSMISQDIANGEGVGVVDPHGELIDEVLDYIPDERIDDVVIVDPSDVERPVGINIMEMTDKSQKNLMASALVSGMKQHFDYSWGPRLEYLLNYSVLTLLEVPGTSMLGITRLLNDMNYQRYILHQIKDPVVLDFWEEEYKAMRGNQRLITEAVAPIQNKINRFLSSTTIRNIVGQRKSTIDIWDIMNNGKILLLNLSKGRIGEDNANLLGALLVSRIQFMAMQRVKIPRDERRPFYLYVDEFQNFTGGNFESILSESRKYRLGLHLTHQYTSQLPENLLNAVFGNVGTIASFSLGAPDANVLQTEFAPYFDENDLISLRQFQMYIKLIIDGQTSKPFSATIFRPWVAEEAVVEVTGNKQKTIERSRSKYGADREYVESKIRKWVEYPFDKGKAIAQEYKGEGTDGGSIKLGEGK